jgi:hypothetical protein
MRWVIAAVALPFFYGGVLLLLIGHCVGGIGELLLATARRQRRQ